MSFVEDNKDNYITDNFFASWILWKIVMQMETYVDEENHQEICYL